METPTKVAMMSAMTVCGISLNALYLFYLYTTHRKVTATVIAQMLRTSQILLSLILVTPLDILTALGPHNFTISKDVLNDLLFNTLPVAFLVEAIIRLRVTLCRGDSSVLVSKTSGVFVYMGGILGIQLCIICMVFVPPGFIFLTNVQGKDNNQKTLDILIFSREYRDRLACQVVFSSVCYLLPLTIGIGLYVSMYKIMRTSKSRISPKDVDTGSMASRRSSRSVSIVLCQPYGRRDSNNLGHVEKRPTNDFLCVITWLLLPTCAVWICFLALNIVKMIHGSNGIHWFDMAMIYNKIFIEISYPIADGLFRKKKRSMLIKAISSLCKKRKIDVTEFILQNPQPPKKFKLRLSTQLNCLTPILK